MTASSPNSEATGYWLISAILSAHEDDAERAVRAALDIIAAVAQLKTPAAEPLAVAHWHRDRDSGGWRAQRRGWRARACGGRDTRTSRLGCRLWPSPGQSLSPAPRSGCSAMCSICASSAGISSRALPSRCERGQSRARSNSESRFEAVRTARLTDLIGREDEINFSRDRQRLAWKGEGQVVLIAGEPGIGKSRLAAALARAHRDRAAHALALSMLALPHQQRAAPVHRPARAGGRIQAGRYARAKARKSSKRSSPSDAARFRAAAALFAALLSIPFGERYPPLAAQPNAAAPPDPGGTAGSNRGTRTTAADPVLVRGCSLGGCYLPRAARPDRRARPPAAGPGAVHLSAGVRAAMGRLAQCQHLDARRPRPPQCRKHDYPGDGRPPLARRSHGTDRRKTDGNPLFVEELTKAVLEAGILVEEAAGYRLDGPLPPLAIPATLQIR